MFPSTSFLCGLAHFGMSTAVVGSSSETQDSRRANALKEYQRVLSQHRDIESRVRRLREEVKTLKQQVCEREYWSALWRDSYSWE